MACTAKAVHEYFDKNAPQSSLRAEMAMSLHQDEDLQNFEPSNKVIAPTIFMDFKDDMSSAIEEVKLGVAHYKE